MSIPTPSGFEVSLSDKFSKSLYLLLSSRIFLAERIIKSIHCPLLYLCQFSVDSLFTFEPCKRVIFHVNPHIFYQRGMDFLNNCFHVLRKLPIIWMPLGR